MISETKMFDNLIIKRRTNIAKQLNEYFPLCISKMISDYDYYLEGKSYELADRSEGIYYVNELFDRVITVGNGRVLFGDNTVKIWNLKTCEYNTIDTKSNRFMKCIATFSDGRIIYDSRDDRTIRV
jgi:hypothetical protein